MKRALVAILLLTAALAVGLGLRVRKLRAAAHGPAGGSGVIEGVDVNITSRLSTRIAGVLVREGDQVKKGQVLVELDCDAAEARLASAKARLAAAESGFQASRSNAKSAGSTAAAAYGDIKAAGSRLAALQAREKQARLELERDQALLDKGAIAPAVVDDARSRHDILVSQIAEQRASAGVKREHASALSTAKKAAVAQADSAQAEIDAARAQVEAATVDVGECRLTAPRDGIIATRDMEPGEAVQPGSVVLTLTDLAQARARFYLPNDELSAAAPERKVSVVADAYPKRTFAGTIAYVAPRAEFTPRNVQTREDRERLVYAVEVRIPNRKLLLREGMPVQVTIDGSWE